MVTIRKLSILLILTLGFSPGKLFAQVGRVISDCTIEYDIIVDGSNADAEVAKSMKGATKTVYIKGNQSRSDLISPSYVLTIIQSAKSDTTVVLKEIGATKYLTYLNAEKRKERNKRFEGITYNATSETKLILGYDCTKIVAKLKDGTSFNVYYTSSIVPSYKEYEYQFKEVQGVVLEYETQTDEGKNKIKYSASRIILTPVPASKFDVPKSGYRIL